MFRSSQFMKFGFHSSGGIIILAPEIYSSEGFIVKFIDIDGSGSLKFKSIPEKTLVTFNVYLHSMQLPTVVGYIIEANFKSSGLKCLSLWTLS